MKKIGFLVCALMVGGLFSCTREFVCQCTYKYTGNVAGLPDSTIEEVIIKDTKKKAEENCKRKSETQTNAGVTYSKTCTLY